MDIEAIIRWVLSFLVRFFHILEIRSLKKELKKIKAGQAQHNERMDKFDAAYSEVEKTLTLVARSSFLKETENLYNTGFLSSPKPSYNPFQALELRVSVAQAALAQQVADNWKSTEENKL